MSAESPLAIVVTNVPPAVCGVGDYNARLLDHWQPDRLVRLLVPGAREMGEVAMLGRAEVVLDPLGRGGAFTEAMLRGGDPKTSVLVHYSGFGYAPRGYPRGLLNALEGWRQTHPKARLVFMLHELWDTAAEGTWRAPIEWLHRRHLLRVLRLADGILTNTPQHVTRLQAEDPGLRVRVQPVATNIPLLSAGAAPPREEGTALVFGMQGSRVRSLEALGPGLRDLLASGRLRRILLAGGGAHPRWEPREQACLAALPADVVERHAWLAEAELAALLARSEFGVGETEWKDWGKSTVFMTYAAHGLNILSPHAGTRAEAPFCWLTSIDELRAGTAPLAERAAALQQWYRNTADWPQLVQAYREMLGE